MKLIDGKEVSELIKLDIKKEVLELEKKGKRKPCLVAIIVGNNPASRTYVNSKIKNSELVGFSSYVIELEEDTTEKKLIEEINKLNDDEAVDGFMVQLPLPKHIDEKKITEAISPKKDVDGFHPKNIGRMLLGNKNTIIPATPLGIIELIKYYKIKTEGKNVVVLGRSNIVGKPISILLGENSQTGNATVTVCNSKTNNIKEYTLKADIIVCAIGKSNYITSDMIKEGVVIIDVGINRIEDKTKKNGFRILGDVDFDNVKNKCSYITPVPGGVGPMTIAMLLKNTLMTYNNKCI